MDLPANTRNEWNEWDALCDAFESAWRAGSQPSCESLLEQVPEDQQPGLLTELLLVEFEQLQLAGKVPLLQDYLNRFSAYTPSVESAWQRHTANEHGDSQASEWFDAAAPNALRDWLKRKQRETRKGRAELKLEERVSAWSAMNESKQLPTLLEWIGINWLTDHKRWTEKQRTMMRSATRMHMTRVGLTTVLVVGIPSISLKAYAALSRQNATISQQEAEMAKAKDPQQEAEIAKAKELERRLREVALELLASQKAFYDRENERDKAQTKTLLLEAEMLKAKKDVDGKP